MVDENDRFPTLSGLAAQYLQNYVDDDTKYVLGERYLAGLWQSHFAYDLAWAVFKAQDPALSS